VTLHLGVTQKLLAGTVYEQELLAVLNRDLEDVREVLKAIYLTGSKAPELADTVVAYGEVWNTQIFAALVKR